MRELKIEHVEAKQNELLFTELSRNNYGIPYLHEVMGEDILLTILTCQLFDENISNDDILATVEEMRYRAIKYLGEKYETKCQEAVASNYAAEDEYNREIAEEMRRRHDLRCRVL